MAVSLSRRLLGPDHPDTLLGIRILGHCLEKTGAAERALKVREEGLEWHQKVHGRDHPASLRCLIDLSGSYYNAGRFEEAQQMRNEALDRSRKVLGSEHPETVLAAIECVALMVSAGSRERALHLLAEVSARALPTTASWLKTAALQAWLGLPDDHRTICRRMIDRGVSADEPECGDHATRACCLRPINDAGLLGKVLHVARGVAKQTEKDFCFPRYHLGLGMAEFRNGNFSDAQLSLAAVERGAANGKPHAHRAPIVGTARFFRVLNLCHQGRRDEAKALYSETAAHTPAPPVQGHPCRALVTADDLILWLAHKEAQAACHTSTPRLSKPGKQRRQPPPRRV